AALRARLGANMSRPFLPIVAAVAFHLTLLGAYLAVFHGDLSALVCVGQKQIGTAPYEAVRVGFATGGFDGQFYYAIARDPWKWQAAILDVPAYRHVRLLYPALAWALSGGGDPQRLFWALPLLNLAAIAGLAWLGVRLARHYGVNVWWGFVLPLAVNDGMPLLRNLTDPLATFTVCGLLASWLIGGRWHHLALWAAAALFGREQNAAVVLVVFAAALGTRRYRTVAGLTIVLTLWGGWIALLHAGYGQWPVLPRSDYFFGVPFKGMWFRWTNLGFSGSRASAALHLGRMLLLTLHCFLALYLAARIPDRVVSLVALGGVALAVLTGMASYEDAWSYTRVFVWIPLTIWLAGVRLRLARPMWLLVPVSLWPLLSVATAWHTWRT
ncbi:MAG: hypothetical protein ACYC3I_15575, partial [Gemmataceae bacterium]